MRPTCSIRTPNLRRVNRGGDITWHGPASWWATPSSCWAGAAGPAPVAATARGTAHPHPGRVRPAGRTTARADRGVVRARQDRLHRRGRTPLGEPARVQPERLPGPGRLQFHCALRPPSCPVTSMAATISPAPAPEAVAAVLGRLFPALLDERLPLVPPRPPPDPPVQSCARSASTSTSQTLRAQAAGAVRRCARGAQGDLQVAQRLIVGRIGQLEQVVVDGQGGRPAQMLPGLHRLRRVHVRLLHEPARVVVADGQDGQAQRPVLAGHRAEVLTIAVAAVTHEIDRPAGVSMTKAAHRARLRSHRLRADQWSMGSKCTTTSGATVTCSPQSRLSTSMPGMAFRGWCRCRAARGCAAGRAATAARPWPHPGGRSGCG